MADKRVAEEPTVLKLGDRYIKGYHSAALLATDV